MSELHAKEKDMLARARALNNALVKVDIEGAVACITMLISNYCRNMNLDPEAISQIIYEAIQEHKAEIMRGDDRA
jgi:DNA-binding protein YbaB